MLKNKEYPELFPPANISDTASKIAPLRDKRRSAFDMALRMFMPKLRAVMEDPVRTSGDPDTSPEIAAEAWVRAYAAGWLLTDHDAVFQVRVPENFDGWPPDAVFVAYAAAEEEDADKILRAAASKSRDFPVEISAGIAAAFYVFGRSDPRESRASYRPPDGSASMTFEYRRIPPEDSAAAALEHTLFRVDELTSFQRRRLTDEESSCPEDAKKTLAAYEAVARYLSRGDFDSAREVLETNPEPYPAFAALRYLYGATDERPEVFPLGLPSYFLKDGPFELGRLVEIIKESGKSNAGKLASEYLAEKALESGDAEDLFEVLKLPDIEGTEIRKRAEAAYALSREQDEQTTEVSI